MLDDDPRAPRFIETVSRRGYRFIGATSAMNEGGTDTGDRFLRSAVDRQSDETRVKRRRVELFALSAPRLRHDEEVRYAEELRLRLRARYRGPLEGAIMSLMPRACPECGVPVASRTFNRASFDRRYEAAGGPLIEWFASLPAVYDRLKAHDREGADEAGPFVTR